MKEKKEKDFIVELEVTGKILTKEKAKDEEEAVSQAEEWDYINLPENVEESDVEVIPVDVEEVSQYQLSKAEKEKIPDDVDVIKYLCYVCGKHYKTHRDITKHFKNKHPKETPNYVNVDNEEVKE